jgi:uncharacterized protein
MTRNSLLFIVFFCIFYAFSPILAQDLNSHESAALDCLIAMNVDKAVNLSAKPITEGVFKNSPDLIKYRSELTNFFDKYICWDRLRDYFIEQYCNKFSESELVEMTAFFKTKTGRKYILKLPELQSLYAELSTKVMQDNIDELGTIIKKGK